MTFSTRLLGLGFALLALLSNRNALAQCDSGVVAQVGSVIVTMDDLQQREAAKLLQARYQYYQAESKALEDLIDEKLLEQKAQGENLTVDQLVERDIKSQVKDPTEDQMKVYFEGLETDQPYEAVRGKILEKIRQVRTDKARAAYLKQLRAESNVYVALAPPITKVEIENGNMLGSKDAPVMLVEFADYECPYCQRVAADIKKLQDEFGAKLAVTYKDFPLPMHSRAEKAAEAARCAGQQGKYWLFHDELFRSRELDIDQLKAQARALNLNAAAFDQCLDSGEEAMAVQNDRAQGVRLGLSGTPSFFINGHFVSGALDYKTLHQIISQQLEQPSHSIATTQTDTKQPGQCIVANRQPKPGS